MPTNELYTSPERVRRLLRLVNAFSSSTNPTDEQAMALIENKMAYIDEETGQSFRLSRSREYKNLDYDFWKNGGSRVPLQHSGIITPLSASAGDSLKVWDGSAWTEWVGTYTEGRGSNYFWIDEIEGVLHIIAQGQLTQYKLIDFTYRYNNGARALLNDADGITTGDTAITYDNLTGTLPYQGWATIDSEEFRYSSTTSTVITATERGAFSTTAATHSDNAVIVFVPSDIVDCCTMLVAIDLLSAEDWSSGGMNSGDVPGSQLSVASKIAEWKEKAEKIIAHRKKEMWAVV